MPATQPIRNKHQARALAEYYLKRGEPRNHLLIILGIHTALRISDLLQLTWDDVFDFDHERFRESVAINEQKTKKTKLVALNTQIIAALRLCQSFAMRGDYLIKSRKGSNKSISRIQAYRLIRSAAAAIGHTIRISCHSLRKTFGYHLWKNGISPTVIMEIYNHSNFAVTRRYLGVTQDDKNEAYHKLAEIV